MFSKVVTIPGNSVTVFCESLSGNTVLFSDFRDFKALLVFVVLVIDYLLLNLFDQLIVMFPDLVAVFFVAFNGFLMLTRSYVYLQCLLKN